MRRKSIGATSQAFHEPMSTGAFLEFLTRLGCRDAGLRGLLARLPGAWGPAAEMREPLFPTKTTQTSQITIFRKPPGGSLAKAWVSAETAASEVGTWREPG